jgi:hypothetical protein
MRRSFDESVPRSFDMPVQQSQRCRAFSIRDDRDVAAGKRVHGTVATRDGPGINRAIVTKHRREAASLVLEQVLYQCRLPGAGRSGNDRQWDWRMLINH